MHYVQNGDFFQESLDFWIEIYYCIERKRNQAQ